MTVDSKWIGYEGWRNKEEAIKQIATRHKDLANIIRLKNRVYSMADELESTIGDTPDDAEAKIWVDKEDLQSSYTTLEEVVKVLKHDMEILAKEYGEDICHL